MSKQSKDLALWALGQKNIPDGKQNFVFKELNDTNGLKRLFYVGYCKKKTLYNVTVLDNSKPETIQILQAREHDDTLRGISRELMVVDEPIDVSTGCSTVSKS